MDKEKEYERTERDWNTLFKSLYSQYYEKLCIFATSIIGDDDEAEAEEIVQHVIFKLWEQRDKFDTIGNISSYLYRSVKNNCLNEISHKKIHDKYQSETLTELKEIEIQAVEHDNDDERKGQLKKAIEQLPERCQEVLVMSKFEGLKHKEIAEQLNISIKAVEANITRAFTLLRKYMKV